MNLGAIRTKLYCPLPILIDDSDGDFATGKELCETTIVSNQGWLVQKLGDVVLFQ